MITYFNAYTMFIQCFDSTNSIQSFHFAVSGFSICHNLQPFERLSHLFTKNLHPLDSRSRYPAGNG